MLYIIEFTRKSHPKILKANAENTTDEIALDVIIKQNNITVCEGQI